MSADHEEQDGVTAGNRHLPVARSYHDVYVTCLWPRNPTGWVFLGRAVHVLGALLHADWRRYTPYGLLPDVHVGVAVDGALIDEDEQNRYASWLINKRGDDPEYIFRTNRPFDYLEATFDAPTVSEQEWDLACDLSQEEWAIGMGNIRMFRDVQLRMVQEAEAGNLNLGCRPLEGGEPKAMPRDWWFTDRYSSRFETLTINPDEPFAREAPKADAAQHIFVKAEDLDRLVAEQPANIQCDGGQSIPQGLSPYIRLMHEVRDHLGVESGKQPQIKKAVLVEEILSRWMAYDLPPSQKLVDAMATMLRDPESQAGRGLKNLLDTKG